MRQDFAVEWPWVGRDRRARRALVFCAKQRRAQRSRPTMFRATLCALAVSLALGVGAAAGADSPAAAGTLSLEAEGFCITTPADGRLVLGYPSLLDKAQKPTPPTDVKVSGDTASIEYPGGVKLAVTREGAEIKLHFTGVTEAAHGFRMEMILPGEFKDGGRFQLQGEAMKPFPAEYHGEQSVFKGQPKPVTLIAPHGSAIKIEMPYGWHQIQDARQWNTPTFNYQFATEMPRGASNEAWFAFKLDAGGGTVKPAGSKTKTAPAAHAPGTSLRLTREGLMIEAGSAGQFTLTYPVFVGEKWDDVRKPIETTVSGNSATLKYDGDGRLEAVLQPGEGTLKFTVSGMPAGVKSLRSVMMIDFSYATGGSWKIGDGKETPFPAQKPANPHIYQGNAETLTLRNFDGATVALQVPPYSFQELTDNREWGWKIFRWQFGAPCQADAGPLCVKIAFGAPSADAPKLVDRFGQSARVDYPGKVKTEEELKQDDQAEAAWVAGRQPSALDAFGGLPGSREKLGLKQTGFFHVEKKDGRWILADPDGNAFFQLGVCGFGPSDDYTYFGGRERVFEWLPPREGGFASAFHPDAYWKPNVLSFHLVNTIRKTGRPYDSAAYTARMIERVRKWGFNSAGAFGAGDWGARQQVKFPHVAHLPLETWQGFQDIPGTHGVFDPYSTRLRERCEKLFAEKLPPAADDPLLIGYFLANEPLYEEIPGAVAALDGSHPCKRRLAQMLEEKYKTIEAFNSAWEVSLASFADVAARGLAMKNAAAKEDMRKYTGIFLDAYFRLVTQTFRKYDTNHMLIGTRLQPGTINNETVCRVTGRYMDIVSFNYYTHGLDRDLLARVHGWIGDKPMLFSEFYFGSAADSGLTGGAKDVSSQRERGLAYRQYVEQAATLGYVVGIEWFTLVDQATTGRFFEKYNGEAANTGLISVADRPWRAMLDEMMKANDDIYKVFFGEREPFVFDDPRFKPAAKKAQ